MSENKVLEQAERKVFRASFDDGLIDIGIAAFLLIFAVAPLLSKSLGDFWSSFVFLPFWGLVYLVLRWLRKRFVLPRMGSASFGAERMKRLRRGGWVMLALNVVFLLLGIVTFFYPAGPGWLVALRFSAIMLIFCSLVGYFYDLPQLYVYGVLIALAVPVGEWLWQAGYAAHHGFPLVFGLLAALIFLYGLSKFVRLMRRELPNLEEQPGRGDL